MSAIAIRDAEAADLSALTAIRPPETHHRGRLRDAGHPGFRYLVMDRGQDTIGFACLVMRRPLSWANPNDTQHLPQIADLHIAEAWRGQGYGSAFIRALEQLTAKAGHRQLYISVEPLSNPRTYALYERLGYQPLKTKPYFHLWQSMDGDGTIRRGESWLVDMVKALGG